ncbi:RnfH family protein [Undibacterium sp. Ren11W]|uniref:RnfH family protein n=1 Tax=Undibacterium sp. Ren11W TaxID=3413045 RepID=UPI003BF00E13
MDEIALDVKIAIQVCYATPCESVILALEVPEFASLESAIVSSGILSAFPEIDLTQSKVGIFGKIKSLDVNLRQGDRVEIYRALVADPMEARRRRAIKHSAGV